MEWIASQLDRQIDRQINRQMGIQIRVYIDYDKDIQIDIKRYKNKIDRQIKERWIDMQI